MKCRALEIFIGDGASRIAVGTLVQYSDSAGELRVRFIAKASYAAKLDAPVLSAAMVADHSQQQRVLFADIANPIFNGAYRGDHGRGTWQLPAFFQNLLPEGALRDHIATQRSCDPTDHFELLAACGNELPGNIYAVPSNRINVDEIAASIGASPDGLNVDDTAAPMSCGASLSGVQPKLALLRKDDRYVGCSANEHSRLIAKLPSPNWHRLPELEHLSLRLAEVSGIQVARTTLEAIGKIDYEHDFDLGNDVNEQTVFLAVERFDRGPSSRIHCEDFAQILNVSPRDKYKGSYLEVATAMLYGLDMPEVAIHELLRRLVVNEMIGNADMHLKNIGVLYLDAKRATLSPAYDIVGFAAYSNIVGHGMKILPDEMLPKRFGAGQKQHLSPAILRAFCSRLEIVEKPAAAAIEDAVQKAAKHWAEMVMDSHITDAMKNRLLARLEGHSMIQSWRRRRRNQASSPSINGNAK